MIFQDKLRYLMELTSTKNRQLANAINVDPAVISRLEIGKQDILESTEYIKYIADYFASQCTEDFQKSALLDVTGYASINFTNIEATSQIIETWLLNNKSTTHLKTVELLKTLDYKDLSYSNSSSKDLIETQIEDNKEIIAFYGNEGKRQANLIFENIVLACENTCDIFISTEGNTDWLWKDKEYATQVSTNIRNAVLKGCNITRIAPRNISLPLALDTIRRWLPLHLTGRVKSYYNPHLRDNVFNRTLYVARGLVALDSISFGDKSESGVTVLTRNPDMIECYLQDFLDYLDICQPETIVYKYGISSNSLKKCVNEFDEYSANCINLSPSLSFVTIPKELFLIGHYYFKDLYLSYILSEHSYKLSLLTQQLNEHTYTEVISLDSFENVISGLVPFTSLLGFQENILYYTPDFYLRHLRNIVYMLYTYSNYHVILSNKNEFESSIFVKEDYSFLSLLNKYPLTVTKMPYSETVAAMWEYAKSKTKVVVSLELNKKLVIAEINDLILKLEDYIYQNN